MDLSYGKKSVMTYCHPPVYSPVSGVIVKIIDTTEKKEIRILSEDKKYLHIFEHFDSIGKIYEGLFVSPGCKIGKELGRMGGTGRTGRYHYNQHVHYEIRMKSKDFRSNFYTPTIMAGKSSDDFTEENDIFVFKSSKRYIGEKTGNFKYYEFEESEKAMEELLTEIEESKGDGEIELVVNVTKGIKLLPIVKNDKRKEVKEIIREINIRLMGFGGGLPSDEYNDDTVKVVKQFKEDYMGLKDADGTFVDMATIEAIDKFADIFKIVEDSSAIFSLADIKCKCGKCSFKNSKGEIIYGFGSNTKDSRKNIAEYNSKTEHPGIHKTLLWIMRAAQFYLKLEDKSITNISDGYRCSIRNKEKGYTTTNHLGKAFDIHFGDKELKTKSKDDKHRIWKTNEVEEIRENIFVDKIGAVQGWISMKIGLEKISHGATSWVHFDIRELGSEYLKDEYFLYNDKEIINPPKIKSLL